MPDHTTRISKEAQTEISRRASLTGQSAKQLIDELLAIGEKYQPSPSKWSDWAKSQKIDPNKIEKFLSLQQITAVAKPPTTIVDALILDLWRMESLKHWADNPIDHSRLSITSKLKYKKTPRTRQQILDYVDSKMSNPSQLLKDTGISWAGLFKQYFESENFKKAIDNRLKELTHQNILYKPTRGTYELELTSINERQWLLIHGLTILPPSRQSSKKPRHGYQMPPLIDILIP